jgi:isoleucyl-tRNA synthetase
MAEHGKKMSKSLGNTVSPQDIIKQSAPTSCVCGSPRPTIGKTSARQEIIQTNVDAYRKLRNTIRWMLGTLAPTTTARRR